MSQIQGRLAAVCVTFGNGSAVDKKFSHALKGWGSAAMEEIDEVGQHT